MPRRAGRATLNEVAARAGVSPTTASLVLGGKADQHRISDDTLARVRQAADELDYSPNLLVRSMQRGRTHVVSFFSAFRHRREVDLYMDRLSTAVELASGSHGYDVLVHCDFTRSPEATYEAINGGRADGLLFFAPLPTDPLLPLLRASRLPVVLMNARDPEGVLPSVADDVESGMRQVADTLADLGHTRVAALLEEGREFRNTHERVGLLAAYLGERGIALPAESVHHVQGACAPFVRALMAGPDAPTAIFCWRDRLAYYVLEACDELGIRVPRDVSVVGYDGLHWPAATRHTAASVHVDLGRLADGAVALLDRCVTGKDVHMCELRVPVVFRPGTTLAPPGADATP